MLKVRKRVDGIPIFDKFDRPLYHLDTGNESEKYVVVVDEINNIEGHFIELKDCLKEKYEKIDIYTKSPLSTNTYTIEDQTSIKSVLSWISKWNNKKKTSKSIKINKSKSKYIGKLNNEIPLIIKLFKYKNKKIETSTIHCNLYTEENILETEDKSKKTKKNVKSIENKKKQNKKKSTPKPNLLCIPKFGWMKKKEQKEYDSSMSIDDFQFQNSDLSSFLPIKANNIFDQTNYKKDNESLDFEVKTTENINVIENSLKRGNSAELTRENSKKRNITIEVDNVKEKKEIKEEHKSIGKNKQSLQSLVIPTNDIYKSNSKNSSKDLSASTLGSNDYYDYPKYQEPLSYMPSPSYSTASTLVSPITPVTPKVESESKFEIDSCDYADYLKDKINEDSCNNEISELERKHFSLPVSPENTRRTRRRSYAFSLTSNEFNLIYSEANHAVISGLCQTVENKQKSQIRAENNNSPKSEGEKPFVKGHARTQSRHRRSHAVCLSSEQLMNFGSEDDLKQKRRSKYMNRDSCGASLSTYAMLNSNSKANKDTLKRRSTNMIKGKTSSSSLSSTNSYCSNSGSMRPVSTNRLSRDIELLRAMKMKRSRSVPKLDQPESISSSNRSPVNSRFSMDASTYKENIGISLRSNSTNNLAPPSNIVYYSFNTKNENNSAFDGYKRNNNRGSYGLFADTINQQSNNGRWSNAFESSSCGSSTYYYSEEDGAHYNESSIVNPKEDLFNLINKSNTESSQNESSFKLPPPTPMIGMI
jgi:hypothetical protein